MQFIYDKDKSVGTTLTQVLWGGGGGGVNNQNSDNENSISL